MDHRNSGVAAQRQRRDKVLEMRRPQRPAGETDDLAVAVDDLARKHCGPKPRHLAGHGLDDHIRRRFARREALEVIPVRDRDVGHRPDLGRVDQFSRRIVKMQAAGLRQRLELGLQHFMR